MNDMTNREIKIIIWYLSGIVFCINYTFIYLLIKIELY